MRATITLQARVCSRVIRTTLLLLGALALLAPAASARTIETFDCGGTRGSGESDVAGNLYLPCAYETGAWKSALRVYSPTGVRIQTVLLPFYANDVAPSPDGSTLYVSRRDSHKFLRLNRGLDGSYVVDENWSLAPFTMWGTPFEPLGEFLSTDDSGFLYVSSGTWTTAPNAVIKYTPDGAVVAQFGEWENSWNTGIFYWVNGGVAASDDGTSVYVTEVGNNRVQRFDRNEDGSYSYRLKWGNDPAIDDDPRTGICGDPENIVRDGRLAAPYDVGVDRTGVVYVLNTTCTQVEAFTADGVWLWTEQLPDTYKALVHGVSVAANGDLYFPQIDRVLRLGEKPPPTPIAPGFRGWALVHTTPVGGTFAVWKWTAAGWTTAALPDGERVWTQLFGPGWQWVWSNGAWYAARPAGLIVELQ